MKKRGNFLFIEKDDDTYTLSMTQELQDDKGTVGFVEFTEEEEIMWDDAIMHMEASIKVMEVASALERTIVERNEAAIDEPALLKSAKSNENWLVKLIDVDEETFNQLEEA